MAVFVLDKHKKPLMPCSEKRARLLLERKEAVVHTIAPFTIRLKERVGGLIQPVRIKIDPGSKTTGFAVVREEKEEGGTTARILFQAELHHRGGQIKKKLDQRRAFRRRRRSRLRYRKPRFDNRTRPSGWLPPSLRHRVDTTLSWVERFRRLVPVSGLSQELVRFDTQRLENPEISGTLYQQGTLFGYEVREYLLEKWGRQCAYCGAKNVLLEIDHVRPRWNRIRFGIPKGHSLDAACVGSVDRVTGWNAPVLAIKATGRGTYQRTRLDAFGFPRGYLTREKRHFSFQTGDRVRAVVPAGKKAGTHVGRVAVRASGSFNIQTGSGVVQGISHKHCRLIQRSDGYGYSLEARKGEEGTALSLPALNGGLSRATG